MNVFLITAMGLIDKTCISIYVDDVTRGCLVCISGNIIVGNV